MPRPERPIDLAAPGASLAEQLRRYREAAGLSVRTLAGKIHYSVGFVSEVASGRKVPTWSFVQAFADACGVSDPRELSRLRALFEGSVVDGPAPNTRSAAPVQLPAAVQEDKAQIYAVAWPIVYSRLTRSLELRRGHFDCARSVQHLRDGCLDRFHDDVEAVVQDVLLHAPKTIQNLEGWIAARLVSSTVDGNRRRRGERGALQRPRVPGWLRRELRDDPWLCSLALEMLVWVGVPTSASDGIWPVDVWLERRRLSSISGSDDYGRRALEADIDLVTRAMRSRPQWYANYVERPLGLKQPLVFDELQPEHPVTSDTAVDDAGLVKLAALALEAIRTRIAGGTPVEQAVEEVIRVVFGSEESRAGHTDTISISDPIRALLEPEAIERIVTVVKQLVGDGAPAHRADGGADSLAS